MVHKDTIMELIETVRVGDYDRFLAIQLAPAGKRAALYAIAALHVELGHVAQVVSEPLIGHIRLAWWREALQEIAEGKSPRNHSVVLALAEVCRQYSSILPLLQQPIEAHAVDVEASTEMDADGWRIYGEQTAGALQMAWAQVLERDAAERCAAAIAANAQVEGAVRLRRYRPEVDVVLREADLLPLPRSLKPLRGLAALTRMHAARLAKAPVTPPSRLAAVWQILRQI